jgi:hypothetical protein
MQPLTRDARPSSTETTTRLRTLGGACSVAPIARCTSGVGSRGSRSWRPSGLTVECVTAQSRNKPVVVVAAGLLSGDGSCLTRGKPPAEIVWAMLEEPA